MISQLEYRVVPSSMLSGEQNRITRKAKLTKAEWFDVEHNIGPPGNLVFVGL